LTYWLGWLDLKQIVTARIMELVERPLGYIGPDLDPANVRFRPKRLSEGVYALVASPLPCDNLGAH
jgi:hypothetical protein